MNWGAHKADVRIAAKNSVTMRAALRASINAQAIYEAYQDTHPFVSDNITQDRARARAWAMLHVKIDAEPVKAALAKIYADGFLLGLDASKEAIERAEKTRNKTVTKADNYIDWANWKPGNRAAALLYRPTGAFEKILSDAGIVSKTIAKAGYDRIGTALADSIAAGFSPGRAAKVITAKIGDPARALTIAITEQNRAMSMASLQNYQDYGLEKVEWSGANPCDLCAPNEGQVVPLGQAFNTGVTQPPVHPNCRCALLPVLDDAAPANEFATNPESFPDYVQNEYLANPESFPDYINEEIEAAPVSRVDEKFYNNQAKELRRDLTNKELDALAAYKGNDYDVINRYLRMGDDALKLPRLDPIEDAKIRAIWESRIDEIKAAIKKAPELEQPIIVYRGVNRDFGDELWSSSVGDEYQDKGFVSTSFREGITRTFGFTRLEITLPAGTKGIAIGGLVNRGESEYLLTAGTKFRIIGKEANPRNAASQYERVIKVEVIP